MVTDAPESTDLQKIVDSCVCAECHSGMIAPWSPILNKIILVCSKDRNHQGYVKLDPAIERLIAMKNGENDVQIDEEIQRYQISELENEGRKHSMVAETKLARYQGCVSLKEHEAREILLTC